MITVADVGALAGFGASTVVVVGAVAAVVHWAKPRLRRLGEFLDDWHGEPSRPGVPARPGVMTRLANLEQDVKSVDRRVADVEHELHPNSGASLRDAVDRIDSRIGGAPPNRKA